MTPEHGRAKVFVMGARAREVRRRTERKIRPTRLSDVERKFLLEHARYEGSADHKRNPGDFGLTPPAAPRWDKTLCDEANVFNRAVAENLFIAAIEAGLVSEDFAGPGYPKHLWVFDGNRVFEAIAGSHGAYHGYPIRKTDPLFDDVVEAWRRR